MKELNIPSACGFCKSCFNLRREGSAYCGECAVSSGSVEAILILKERFKIYIDDQEKFPLYEVVKKQFPIHTGVVFTYGNTIYAESISTPGLIVHELTHTFQQGKIGVEKWWDKYLKSDKFRLQQESEAYQNQYQCWKRNLEPMIDLMLDSIAGDLSGKLYGNIIKFEEAKKLIINK